MDSATRSKRHSDLWEAGTTRVNRTVVSGLIFASVIFFNVILPYAETAESRAESEKALAAFEAQQQQASDEIERVKAFEDRLGAISRAVELAAWSRHKDELIQRFRSGAVADAQAEADRTVHLIAAQVRAEVLEPLEAAVTETGISGTPAEHPAHLQVVIDDWERQMVGQSWYRTRERKEQTITELGTTLETIQHEARKLLAEVLHSVDAARKDAVQSQAELASAIEAERQEIQQALDEAIPAWAEGLMSVERMVPLYPWIMAALAAYLVASALVAAHHYHAMAKAEGWSPEDRCDPLLTSIWTLTWRGPVGTAVTVLCYLAVLATLGAFLHHSIGLMGAAGHLSALPYLVLIICALCVVASPLRARSP